MNGKYNCYRYYKCCNFRNKYMEKMKILNICASEYEYFFRKPNVVGVGLGYKTVGQIYTFKPCILVFVSQKLNINELAMQQLIPPIYKGMTTDVVETGFFTAQSLKKRVRPVLGGYSIGPVDSTTTLGSMACLVTDGHDKFILSNNHVLANENSLPLGTPIVQPAAHDGGKSSHDIVAHLSKYVPLKFESGSNKPPNFVDCAMAKIVNNSIASSKIEGIGIPSGIGTVKLNEKVQKSGRTTGKTHGTIISLGASIEVQYYKGKVLLVNQILTTDMTKGGDSGALLLDEKKDALGLLASGSENHSTFNLIDNVLDDLGVDIVTE